MSLRAGAGSAGGICCSWQPCLPHLFTRLPRFGGLWPGRTARAEQRPEPAGACAERRPCR